MRRLSYFARETLISLRRNLLMTLAGILTVTVSLLLLGGILLFQQWVDHGTNKWKHGVEFEVYMKTDATKEQIDALRNQLSNDRQIKSDKYISKEQAYSDFKRIFKDKPDLVSSVDPSALPASFRVAPTQVRQTTELRDKYNTRPGVDEAITADKAIKQLIDITNFLRYMFIAISTILIASSLFLIVNTIRLATFARRREIEVMKLVGATEWFVRGPFVIEGVMTGLIAAAVALLVLVLSYPPAVARFSADISFIPLSYDPTFISSLARDLLVGGALLGALGSYIGVRRFVRL